MKSVIAAAAVLTALSGSALAQSDYPNRPVTIIVNITPGSGTDLIARTVADGLKTTLKQPIVVENRPGAGGSIGAHVVANSEPDGYRLLVTSSAIASLPAVQKSLPYDTEKDLTPIAALADLPAVIWVSPTKGIKSVTELIEKARKTPGEVMFGSSGVASASHLEVERMRAAAKITLTHVPYRGAPEAIADTAAGRVDFVIAPLASGRAFMDNKQLIPIASTAKKRSPLIPDVPTIGESGLKMRMGAWVGLFGPKGMPAELVQKIHAATMAALEMPEAKDRFAKLGGDVMPLSPAEFKKMVSDEIAENKELLASLSQEKK
ncbi:tripartite tricarboxylate transporter substrate binding protein [Pseudorhodoplanes sp.]|uniref:Bug family tripartite tricarboxylate transporter substrate binding protein n=1 Tax=Pseudorhodoplanes sp. TaxID=1934341 RepID=UPI002BB70737|nr:tripartite tricarboxylate transporter substrate binding protein [Pseudorhodoplanes sp.]HWV51948.1 tripartite tricarboxylate transporter substrate binding protein [Pseudorhodoplanes sp.]